MIKEEEAGTTGAQVRGDIQSGITGEQAAGLRSSPGTVGGKPIPRPAARGSAPNSPIWRARPSAANWKKGPDPSFNSAMRGPERLWAQGAALALARQPSPRPPSSRWACSCCSKHPSYGF